MPIANLERGSKMTGLIGITRKIDHMGRVTLPKEYRDFFKMPTGKRVEIFATDEGILIRVPNRETAETKIGTIQERSPDRDYLTDDIS